MITKYITIILMVIAVLFVSCKEEDPFGYEIEYQEGNPSIFVGTWSAFDVNSEGLQIGSGNYDLITAVDPNNTNMIVFDNIYNANLRVKSFVDRANDRLYVQKGKQLEITNAAYDIQTISIQGWYIEDISQIFENTPKSEALYLNVGMYDEYNDLYDTILIWALRKTGLEDIEEYEYDFIFNQ